MRGEPAAVLVQMRLHRQAKVGDVAQHQGDG